MNQQQVYTRFASSCHPFPINEFHTLQGLMDRWLRPLVRVYLTDAATHAHDCQFSSHRRCVLSGSLCPAAGQVAHYPIPAKVARWHWDKHYTPHMPAWLKIAVAHEDVRMVERQRKWLQGTTTAQRFLDKRDLSALLFFKASRLLLLPWMGGWRGVVMCAITSRRLEKGGWLSGGGRVWLRKDATVSFPGEGHEEGSVETWLNFAKERWSRIQKSERGRPQLLAFIAMFCPVLISFYYSTLCNWWVAVRNRPQVFSDRGVDSGKI